MQKTDGMTVVQTVHSVQEAELIKAYLGSQGISALVQGESYGRISGFTYGPLSEVDVLVPAGDSVHAKELIARTSQNEKVARPKTKMLTWEKAFLWGIVALFFLTLFIFIFTR